MKDFDLDRQARRETASQRERTFTIGGEQFTYRVDVPFDVFREFIEDRESPATLRSTRLITEVLEEEGVGRFEALLKRRSDDPITMDDFNAVVSWLIEETGGHPTEPPSPSSGSPATNGATSTDGSSSQPVEASAP